MSFHAHWRREDVTRLLENCGVTVELVLRPREQLDAVRADVRDLFHCGSIRGNYRLQVFVQIVKRNSVVGIPPANMAEGVMGFFVMRW